MVSLEFSKSDEWTDDDYGALHPLSAAEHYARRLNRNCLYDCTNVSLSNDNSIHHTIRHFVTIKELKKSFPLSINRIKHRWQGIDITILYY